MTHIRILIAAIAIATCNFAQAQTQQKINIDEVTVFLNGAELVSSVKLSLAKGENEFLFTNIAGDVNSTSLNVTATGGVVLEGATFQNNYLVSDNLSPSAKALKDSIEAMNTKRQQADNKVTTLKEEVAVLLENRKVSGNAAGLSVAELQKMLELINNKMEGLLNEKDKYETVVKKINEHITRLQQQLDEEQKKQYQPGGQLLVKFYAKEAVASDITLKYITPNAGWTPIYDVWADDINSPIKLSYKANVYQNSGVKWDNIKLSLSTGNPNESAQPPTLNPWYLAFYNPYNEEMNLQGAMNSMPMSAGKAKEKMEIDRKVTEGSGETKNSSMNEYVQVDNSGVNTTFDIDLPYTLPSDGQEHLVTIKKYDVPSTYRYFAIPKLDKDVFLQARITNWEDLNLLPGQTNIFYDGTYVGQGYIDPRNVQDTMTISLGRDKKIVIKRERDKKLRSVKTFGSNVRETFAYNITVRNARKETATITILDQLPISTDKDIDVEDIEIGDVDYDDTTGIMKWNVTLNANETKKLDFGYTLKYPKGKNVSNSFLPMEKAKNFQKYYAEPAKKK